jgi:hypothetical protein
MSVAGYSIGYGLTPAASRWKKGQSGNPEGRRLAKKRSDMEKIDQLLFARVKITFMGKQKAVYALEAIVLRLIHKELEGSVKAAKVLLKYKHFAKANITKKLKITFVDNAYTRALANLPDGGASV